MLLFGCFQGRPRDLLRRLFSIFDIFNEGTTSLRFRAGLLRPLRHDRVNIIGYSKAYRLTLTFYRIRITSISFLSKGTALRRLRSVLQILTSSRSRLLNTNLISNVSHLLSNPMARYDMNEDNRVRRTLARTITDRLIINRRGGIYAGNTAPLHYSLAIGGAIISPHGGGIQRSRVPP